VQKQLNVNNEDGINNSNRRTVSLSYRVGQIANMLADGMDGALAAVNDGEVPYSPGALWSNASAPSSGRRSKDSAGSTLSARLARASELFTVAERLLGQKLPGEEEEGSAHERNVYGGDAYGNGGTTVHDGLIGVHRPYIDIPLLTGDAGGNGKFFPPQANGALQGDGGTVARTHPAAVEDAVARISDAVQEARRDADSTIEKLRRTIEGDLFGQGEDSKEALNRLEGAQRLVDDALEAVRVSAAAAAALREDHAYLARTARTCQSELDAAQSGLSAAMEAHSDEGSLDGHTPTEAVISNAAKRLTEAEERQTVAAERVYDAERALHKAVADDLAARNALVSAQSELSRCMEDAMTFLAAAAGPRTQADALTISPLASLGPAP